MFTNRCESWRGSRSRWKEVVAAGDRKSRVIVVRDRRCCGIGFVEFE